VTAWAAENRLVLGTSVVADGSNEVAAIPELLRTLDLAGALATIDAGSPARRGSSTTLKSTPETAFTVRTTSRTEKPRP